LNRFAVNSTLWNVIQKLYPKECEERNTKEERKEFEQALINLRGEDFLDDLKHRGNIDGALEKLRDEATWLSQDVKFERTVVRDPDDYVMHVALALERYPDPFPHSARYVGGGMWTIGVCILELEEDEDEDGGFPAFLTNSADDRSILHKRYEGDVELVITRLGDDIRSVGPAVVLNGDYHTTQPNTVLRRVKRASGGVVSFDVELDKGVKPGNFQFCFNAVELKGCNMHFESAIHPYKKNAAPTSIENEPKTTSKYFAKASRPLTGSPSNYKSISLDDTVFEDEAYEEEESDDDSMDGFVVDDDEPIEMQSGAEEDDSDGMEEVVIIRRKKKTRTKKKRKKLVRKMDEDESELESCEHHVQPFFSSDDEDEDVSNYKRKKKINVVVDSDSASE